MVISFHKNFLKHYKRLPRDTQQRVNSALLLFEADPFSPVLKTHKLQGKQKSYYAFRAGYDVRIIFEEKNGFTEVLMLEVGTHEQVYY